MTDPRTSHTHVRTHARVPWSPLRGPKPFVGTDPLRILKALVWLMRDRGKESPDDLRGCTRGELERAIVQLRAPKRTAYASFDEALADAIGNGWVDSYEWEGELFFLPNYRHACPTHRTGVHVRARETTGSTQPPERETP